MSKLPKITEELQEKIKQHTALIGVVSLGYVGLPFANGVVVVEILEQVQAFLWQGETS
ncbi:MAG: hypothetical protein F6K03_06825 [Kamptonema sp. SIO4C4]|nr:hypothetical protein [Kamptonema sp. SIO4C4]